MLLCLVVGHLAQVIYLLLEIEICLVFIMLAINMLQIVILHCHSFYLRVIQMTGSSTYFGHLVILFRNKIPFSSLRGPREPTHVNCKKHFTNAEILPCG